MSRSDSSAPGLARFTFALALLLTTAPAARGQNALHVLHGTPGSMFGTAVAGAGDVDGDGIPDVIVGAVWDHSQGTNTGAAVVFSGASGAILHRFFGKYFFGSAVDGAGDIDGDGFADLIVGVIQDPTGGTLAGAVRLYSGKTGLMLREYIGSDSVKGLGADAANAGDVDGDGVDDLIAGAWVSQVAVVYSGATGAVLHTFKGPGVGHAVDGIGDVDGDGTPDLIVGAPGDSFPKKGSGSATVYSGKTGERLFKFGGKQGDFMGTSVAGAGDVDGDGVPDMIVSARLNDAGGENAGRAYVYSGADGSVLHVFQGDSANQWLGDEVAGAGDLNGDGYADLLVGARGGSVGGATSGSVFAFSGRDGSLLYAVHGDDPKDLMGSAAGIGDIDGDGFDDWIVGANHDGQNGLNSGTAWVLSGRLRNAQRFCDPAVPNSSGAAARAHLLGNPFAAQNHLLLVATELPPDQTGYFLFSRVKGFVPSPGGSQGNLCLGGVIGRLVAQVGNSGSGGSFTIQVDLANLPTHPPHTVVAGETWYFQAWYRDDNPGPTSNFTDAVGLTFL